LTGLLYGGGTTVLAAQAIGSVIVASATFAVSLAVMYSIKAIGILRVSVEGEGFGLDLYEHGMPAYPEYQIADDALPAGVFAITTSQSVPDVSSGIDVNQPEAAAASAR
jgi:Amt family ammonium transporter